MEQRCEFCERIILPSNKIGGGAYLLVVDKTRDSWKVKQFCSHLCCELWKMLEEFDEEKLRFGGKPSWDC